MNGINSIRTDVNITRHDTNSPGKRIVPVNTIDSATEADKKKSARSHNTRYFDLNQHQANHHSESPTPGKEYYRANLLNEMYQKMSGIEPRHHPGHFIEYYA